MNFIFPIALLLFGKSVLCSSSKFHIDVDLPYVESEQYMYIHLFQSIQVEHEFKTCLLFGHSSGKLQEQQALDRLLQREFLKPMLIYNMQSVHRNVLVFSKALLVVMYWEDGQDFAPLALEKLALNLAGMTNQARIIFILAAEHSNESGPKALTALFSECRRLGLLNAIALFRNFSVTAEFYSYAFNAMLPIRTEVKYLFAHMEQRIFPSRLLDLHGSAIRTTYQTISLHTAVLINMAGGQRIVPHPHKVLKLLSEKLNATLQYTYNFEATAKWVYDDLHDLLTNNSVDILSNLDDMTEPHAYAEHSYPVEMAKRCVLVPTGGQLQFQNFFASYINWLRHFYIAIIAYVAGLLLNLSGRLQATVTRTPSYVRFADFILQMPVVAAFMGLPLVFRVRPSALITQRFVIYFVSICGVMYNSAFLARINAYLNTPPMEAEPLDLESIQLSPLKILISRSEFDELMRENESAYVKYSSVFQVLENFEEYAPLSNAIDTRFAYPITTSNWPAASSFYKLVTITLVRTSSICFKPLLYLSFPLARNSMYKEPLQDIIMRAQAAGLMQYWAAETFDELSTTAWLKPTQSGLPGTLRVLTVQFFLPVWYLCAISSVLSFTILALELLYYHKLKHYRVGRWFLKCWKKLGRKVWRCNI